MKRRKFQIHSYRAMYEEALFYMPERSYMIIMKYKLRYGDYLKEQRKYFDGRLRIFRQAPWFGIAPQKVPLAYICLQKQQSDSCNQAESGGVSR